MKTKIIYSAIIFIHTITTLFSQNINLLVKNGYGSGKYNIGDTVHIWAKATFKDTLFNNWSGSGKFSLIDGDEWHNRIVIPYNSDNTISIKANYEKLSPSTKLGVDSFYLYGEDFDGLDIRIYKRVFYGIPSNPKAMIFLLHGTGGSGYSFFNKFERLQLVKELLNNGYAVFGVDANESTIGDVNQDGYIRWKNTNIGNTSTTNNVDIKNMYYIKDSIIQKFNFLQDIPVFSLGMSNGANFSDLCATSLRYKASVHITAKGNRSLYRNNQIIPVMWIASENDHQAQADNVTAKKNFDNLKEKQPTSEFYWFKRSPVYPQRFYRSLYKVKMDKSKEIYDALSDQELLDDNNLLDSLKTDEFLVDFMDENDNFGLNRKKQKSVREQFLCINADHMLHSDFSKRIVDFYNKILSETTSTIFTDKVDRIKVFPNPSQGDFNIELSDYMHTSYSTKLSIFDINGKIIREYKNIAMGYNEYSMCDLPNGIYFWKLTNLNKLLGKGKWIKNSKDIK